MPFTALKPGQIPLKTRCDRCAPPNAVYGIETSSLASSLAMKAASCAPPNAVYGIETKPVIVGEILKLIGCAPPNAVYGIETSSRNLRSAGSSKVVRRLMPFTALKPYFSSTTLEGTLCRLCAA